MAEEKKTNYGEQSNSVALVGMIFSIVGLLLTVSVIFSRLGIPLLILGFILGIIGLFSKPRGKARTAILISLIVLGIIVACIAYLWKYMKLAANDYTERRNNQIQNLNSENFDEYAFNEAIKEKSEEIIEYISTSPENFDNLYSTSSGTNILQKIPYMFFLIIQQGTQNVLDTYQIQPSSQELNISTEETPTIEEGAIEEITTEEPSTEETSTMEESTTTESIEVFTESEQNDIEQIINILE